MNIFKKCNNKKWLKKRVKLIFQLKMMKMMKMINDALYNICVHYVIVIF